MNRFTDLANLNDALDELDYLHKKLEWTSEETMVLRATVKLQDVIRNQEQQFLADEYEELDEDYESAVGDLRLMRSRLTEANNRISELEVELGQFQIKLATVEGRIESEDDFALAEGPQTRYNMGFTIIEDIPKNCAFKLGDLVRDTMTQREGRVTGWATGHDGMDRYEILVQDEIFGEYPLYCRDIHLEILEYAIEVLDDEDDEDEDELSLRSYSGEDWENGPLFD